MKSAQELRGKGENWTNVSAIKCMAISDIFAKLQQTGIPMPHRPSKIELENSQTLLEYAQMIAENDHYWKTLPAVVIPSELQRFQLRKRVKVLAEIMGAGANKTLLDQMVATASDGTKKGALRRKLRTYIAQSR